MAGSVNKVILVGRLGKDPEMRFTPSGKAVTNFSMATSEYWSDAGGERQERTEWHRIVIWGKLAEVASKYLTKGSQVYIEGRLQTRKYDDSNGIERQTTEIVASALTMLGGKGEGGNDPGKPDSSDGTSPDDLDSIPF